MGFNRGEIRIKATNISIMDRKGGKSIMGCRVMSGAITTTANAHSHLGGSQEFARRFFAPHYAGDWGPYGEFYLACLKIWGMYS